MSEIHPDRREFLAAAGLIALAPIKSEADGSGVKSRPGLMDTSASPHVKIRAVGLGETRWTEGFWAHRRDVGRASMVPAMWKIMSGTEPSQFFHNFKVAAGLAKGRHRGPRWNDGDFYKWIEAASALLATEPNAELDRLLDEVIAVIAQAQRADGYLHTPVLIRERNGEADAKPFQDKLDFETYNFGHLMTAACVHHRATGKSNLLALARKAADYLCEAARTKLSELAHNAVCPAHYMGLVELYRTTREPRYLNLVRDLIDARELVNDGTDDNQDRIPFRSQRKAVGHAVRANYLYAGVADYFAESGDRTLIAPLNAVWEDVTTRKMAVTGACGALFDGASPDGSKDQKIIGRVHQAYGRDYQLPQSTAHNETCAALGNILWNWRMLQITGEARHADILERVLYNAAPAGVSLDGTKFFYTNTLRQLDTMPAELRWSRERQVWISCYCCPPNLVRTIAESAEYAYGRAADTVWIHLYGACRLDTTLGDGSRVRLAQVTDYPWDGRITIKIDEAPSRDVSLLLRIPEWARGASYCVNGGELRRDVEAESYLHLSRSWKAGDTVELTLPMPVRLLAAHPLVEEARNQTAVQRGPLIYCLESTDLPRGIKLQDVLIPREIELKPRFDGTLLGGLTVLEGQAMYRPGGNWNGRLYRELERTPATPFQILLIPYYAWGNRGKSEMSVWLPLG